MSSMPTDLLRPSLSDTGGRVAAPYSMQVGFFSAFFGGGLAAAGWALLNAWRTGQRRRDAAPLLLLALAAVAWVVVMHMTGPGRAGLESAASWLGPRSATLLDRLAGLALFALAGWLQRREHRSAALFGLASPKGWWVFLLLIVAGNLPVLLADAAWH
jgi:hypothetical protein